MTNWRYITALIGAIVVLFLLVAVFRMRNWIPFAVAAFTWAAIMLATLPRRQKRPPALPENAPEDLPEDVDPSDFEHAMSAFGTAAAKLRELAARAPVPDIPLFEHMADLLEKIREHLRASPGHVTLTRRFLRHTLGRMLDVVSDYVDLANRAGPDQRERLSGISHQMEGFVAVLEKIDRACLDNDLTALEINVEVLNEQFDRRNR